MTSVSTHDSPRTRSMEHQAASGSSGDFIGGPRRACFDRTYVSRIERGIANPTIDVLERIAGVLAVEIAELFVIPQPTDERSTPLPGGRRHRRGLAAH